MFDFATAPHGRRNQLSKNPVLTESSGAPAKHKVCLSPAAHTSSTLNFKEPLDYRTVVYNRI